MWPEISGEHHRRVQRKTPESPCRPTEDSVEHNVMQLRGMLQFEKGAQPWTWICNTYSWTVSVSLFLRGCTFDLKQLEHSKAARSQRLLWEKIKKVSRQVNHHMTHWWLSVVPLTGSVKTRFRPHSWRDMFRIRNVDMSAHAGVFKSNTTAWCMAVM